MMRKTIASVFAAAAGVALVMLFVGAGDGQPPPGSPSIRVDSTPIDRSNTILVTSYADALDEIRESVVSVYSSKIVRPRAQGFPFDDPFFRRFFSPGEQGAGRVQQGVGSGVVVTADGYILTNNHVIDGSDEIRVAMPDGRELVATVVGADPRTDVAVVKVEADGLRFATLADSDGLRIGDIVFAVGNPLGVGQTTTMGIVSATGRSNLRLIDQGYENFIQTDASINPGNSGGALVDAMGRVVGINTAILSTSRGNIGIGFAIPINLASNIMRSLIETGDVARGFLGVELQDLEAELGQAFGVKDGRGAVILAIQPESPAAKAGLLQGDVVTAINGRGIGNSSDLRLTVSQMLPGTSIKVGVMRDGEGKEFEVVLGRLEEGSVAGRRAATNELIKGVRVAPVNDELRNQFGLADTARGLVVVAVEPDSRFGSILPVGTVIEQINRTPVSDLRGGAGALRSGRNLILLTYRGVYRYAVVVLD